MFETHGINTIFEFVVKLFDEMPDKDFHVKKQMELTLTEEDAAHWVYRGEGAANLVLSYTGSSPSYVSSFFCFFCFCL
jgi:hypothetical protein